MNDIIGKTLVFTDFHIGISSNRETRLKICEKVVKNLIEYINAEKISTVMFCGDWHHSRTTLDSNALNVSYKLISELSQNARCILVCGNHDIYLKNSTDINSINIFKDIPNVEIVTKEDVVTMNGKKCLLVPWLADLSKYEKSSFDFMFGHFDISTKFLVSSYVEEHKNTENADEKNIKLIDDDPLLSSTKSKVNDEVGDFVEFCKPNGTIFAGHIHKHKEFKAKRRNFIFVGSPYEQNLGDIDNKCGFYVINNDGSYIFHEINNVPKHIKLFTSKIMENGIDSFDFSIVSGNIIQKIYDKEIKESDDIKIGQKISMFKPYEELLPEYSVDIDLTKSNDDSSITLEVIQKSKLEYVKNYIETIDNKLLEEKSIDKEKLYNMMSEYYCKVTGETV